MVRIELSPRHAAESSCTSVELPAFDLTSTWPPSMKPVDHSLVSLSASRRTTSPQPHSPRAPDTLIVCHSSRRLPMQPTFDAMRKLDPEGWKRVQQLHSRALSNSYPARQLSTPEDAILAAAKLLPLPSSLPPPLSGRGPRKASRTPRATGLYGNEPMGPRRASRDVALPSHDDLDRLVDERRAATIAAVRRNHVIYPLPAHVSSPGLAARGDPSRAATPRERDRMWQVSPRFIVAEARSDVTSRGSERSL